MKAKVGNRYASIPKRSFRNAIIRLLEEQYKVSIRPTASSFFELRGLPSPQTIDAVERNQKGEAPCPTVP